MWFNSEMPLYFSFQLQSPNWGEEAVSKLDLRFMTMFSWLNKNLCEIRAVGEAEPRRGISFNEKENNALFF